MGKETGISWTTATANESFGCRQVDEACKKCYMFRLREKWGEKGDDIKRFNLQRLSKRIASWPKEKNLVFLDDMTDLFGEFNSYDYIRQVFDVVILPNQNREFQLLTKRIGRALIFFRDHWKGQIPQNVWIGCSIGETSRVFRLGQLKAIKALGAKIVYVSFEPLIERLGEFSMSGIDWAIVGGESDETNPRPMNIEWAEDIRHICERDGTAFYFKQIGGKGGNGAGGDRLNGKTYKNYPKL